MSIFLGSNTTVRGLAALYASTFLAGAWAIIIPTIPVLAREFGVSAGVAAQVVTAFAIGKFVGTAIGGVVLDRMGTRIALVGGPLIASAAALWAAWVPWFTAILGLVLTIGAADSLWAAAREMAGIDSIQHNQRGRLISSLHGTHTIGAAVAPFVGGWLTELFSFKVAFLGYAIAAAASVGLGFITPDSPKAAATEKHAGGEGGWGWMVVKRRLSGVLELFYQIRPELRSTYLALCLATLANQSQRMIVQSMLPLYAGVYLHLTPTEIGMLFTISGVIVMAMIIPAGFVMDRVGRKWCTVPSTGVPALVFVLIPLTTSFIELALLVAFAGVAQGLALGSIATSTYDVVPPEVRGRLQAVRRTVAESGSGLAPLLGGYLANAFNPGMPFLVYAPLLAVSAALLATVGEETLEK
jgi:MFS family permease